MTVSPSSTLPSFPHFPSSTDPLLQKGADLQERESNKIKQGTIRNSKSSHGMDKIIKKKKKEKSPKIRV